MAGDDGQPQPVIPDPNVPPPGNGGTAPPAGNGTPAGNGNGGDNGGSVTGDYPLHPGETDPWIQRWDAIVNQIYGGGANPNTMYDLAANLALLLAFKQQYADADVKIAFDSLTGENGAWKGPASQVFKRIGDGISAHMALTTAAIANPKYDQLLSEAGYAHADAMSAMSDIVANNSFTLPPVISAGETEGTARFNYIAAVPQAEQVLATLKTAYSSRSGLFTVVPKAPDFQTAPAAPIPLPPQPKVPQPKVPQPPPPPKQQPPPKPDLPPGAGAPPNAPGGPGPGGLPGGPDAGGLPGGPDAGGLPGGPGPLGLPGGPDAGGLPGGPDPLGLPGGPDAGGLPGGPEPGGLPGGPDGLAGAPTLLAGVPAGSGLPGDPAGLPAGSGALPVLPGGPAGPADLTGGPGELPGGSGVLPVLPGFPGPGGGPGGAFRAGPGGPPVAAVPIGPDGQPLRGPNGEPLVLGPDGRPLPGGLGAIPGLRRFDPTGGRPVDPFEPPVAPRLPLHTAGGGGLPAGVGGRPGLPETAGPLEGAVPGRPGTPAVPEVGTVRAPAFGSPFQRGVGPATAAQELGAEAAAARLGAGAGSGGMYPPPMMGGGGAGGDQNRDRERGTWLLEDDEVWTDGAAPVGVLGRADAT